MPRYDFMESLNRTYSKQVRDEDIHKRWIEERLIWFKGACIWALCYHWSSVTYTYAHTLACAQTHMHTCIHMPIHMEAHRHVLAHICAEIHTDTYLHILSKTHTDIILIHNCTCPYTHTTCTHMHIYTHSHLTAQTKCKVPWGWYPVFYLCSSTALGTGLSPY